MRYRESLWDGSEPDYAPGLSWSREYPYWRAPARYVKAGYSIRVIRLPGHKGDGEDLARAALCREHTQDMLRWWGQDDAPRVAQGTWKWALSRYLTDSTSPIHDVKANTAAGYREDCAYWEAAIGAALMADCNHTEIMRWRNAMRDNGRSDSFIKRKFGALRRVVRYCAALEDADSARIEGILSRIRIKGSRPRVTAPTREQVEAVIAAADQAGHHSFALGLMLQWCLALRAVDIRGHWLDLKPGETPTGIAREGKRWADGLTWDMVDRDVRTLTKTPSKTEGHDPEPLRFDLTVIPEVRERLLRTPPESRVGPIILNRAGLPYTRNAWAHMWRKMARKAGIPDGIQVMDLRAGAITEGRLRGASPYDLRDAAGHSQLSTTDRYTRDRSAGSANVLKVRFAGSNPTG